MTARGGGYGLDAELARKQLAKYDHQAEKLAIQWIEAVTNEKFPSDFATSLKDGQLLCKLVNIIQPGTISKIETSKMPFKQMENITSFLRACRSMGVAEFEVFETVDLFEAKDLGSVIRCLHALSRSLQRGGTSFRGPFLDVTYAAPSAVDITSATVVEGLNRVDINRSSSPPPPSSSTSSTPPPKPFRRGSVITSSDQNVPQPPPKPAKRPSITEKVEWVQSPPKPYRPAPYTVSHTLSCMKMC